MKHMIARTTVLTALLVGTALPAFAEDYVIRVWAGGTDEISSYRHEAIAMAADIYEREAKALGEDVNITVEWQTATNWDEFKQSVALASEAGSAPEILVTGHEDIGAWANAGMLRPIEDYVDFDSWPLNQIYPNLYDVAVYEGRIWGIPQDAEARPFYYSRSKLAAIGYSEADIDALPERVAAGEYTLYDVIEDAKKMIEAGVVEPGQGFLPRPTNGLDYWQFYQSFGGRMLDEDSGRMLFDTVALGKMYQFFRDGVDAGVISANLLGSGWENWHPLVAGDQVGFWHGGSWQKAEWEVKWGMENFWETTQFSLIPAGDADGTPNTITHPLVYLISSNVSEEQAQLAAELIAIASEPRINSIHAVRSGKVAIGSAQADIALMQMDPWTNEVAQLLPAATSVPNDPNFGVVWDAMYRGLEAVWTGTVSVDDAVATARSAVENALGDGVIIR